MTALLLSLYFISLALYLEPLFKKSNTFYMVPTSSSSSEASVNQPHLVQPLEAGAELNEGGAANPMQGVVPPAFSGESWSSNNSNPPILEAPPLQEWDRASQTSAPDPRQLLLSSKERLNRRVENLFNGTWAQGEKHQNFTLPILLLVPFPLLAS